MRKFLMLMSCFVLAMPAALAQEKFFTKNGKISFYSRATLENIEAHNRSVTAVLDAKTGILQFHVLIRGFEFEKALMQEHFNDNYMQSSKYPKAEFKGSITNNGDIDYSKDGDYNAHATGTLSLHGETKNIEADGTISVKGGKLQLQSGFTVQLADFKIRNDKMNNISNTIRIAVSCSLEPLK